MKYAFCFFVFVYCATVYAGLVVNQEEKFLQGNALFLHGDMQKALEAYEAITHKSAVTLYNKGVCLYRLGDYTAALVSWHRAQQVAPWRLYSLLDQAMMMGYQQLNREFPYTGLARVQQWVVRVVKQLSLGWWQLLFLLCWFICLYKVFSLRRVWHVAFLFILLLVVGVGFMVRYRSVSQRYVLVVEQEAALYAGPAADYAVVDRVALLTQLKVDEVIGDWVKVQNRHLAGWISAKVVALIEPLAQ